MSPPQVEAIGRCVSAEPDLVEWLPRYTKAWCKADGFTAEQCGPQAK